MLKTNFLILGAWTLAMTIHSHGIAQSTTERQVLNVIRADSTITAAFEQIKKIDIQNADMIIVYGFWLDDIEKQVNRMNQSDQSPIIPYDNDFKQKFFNRLQALETETKRQRTVIDQLKNNLDYTYVKKGQQLVQEYNYDQAAIYFRKAIKFNKTYQPAHYHLANCLYNMDSLESAATRVISSLQLEQQDKLYNDLLKALGNQVFERYIALSSSLMDDEQYNEAIALLETASPLSKERFIDRASQYGLAMARAKQGLYNAYIKVAGKAVQNDMLVLAEELLNQAYAFQKTNEAYIPSNSRADTVLSRLALKYILTAEKLNHQKKYNEASEVLKKASDLCYISDISCYNKRMLSGVKLANKGIYEQYLSLTRSKAPENMDLSEEYIAKAKEYLRRNKHLVPEKEVDKIISQLYQTQYTNMVVHGFERAKNKNEREAMEQLLQAKELARKHGLLENDMVESVIRSIASPILLNSIKEGHLLAWANNLEGAESIYEKALIQQKRYFMESDSLVNVELRALDINIRERVCLNTRQAYERALDQAKGYLKKEYIVDACRLLDMITVQTIAQKECGVNTLEATRILNDFKYPYEYQKLLWEAESQAQLGHYELFLSTYLKAEQLYHSRKLSDCNLTHKSLYAYLITHRNKALMKHCFYYFTDRKRLSEALNILQALMPTYTPDQLRKELERLGSALADQDYQEDRQKDPQAQVATYTGHQKCFRYLEKRYLKQWRELGN